MHMTNCTEIIGGSIFNSLAESGKYYHTGHKASKKQ
jgi:hypothetical protein